MEATTTPTYRRSGGDGRGNNRDRRARKVNMLRHFGDGSVCPCAWCGSDLTIDTVEADRIVPGSDGGKYRMVNVIPACRRCNASRQDLTVDVFIARCDAPSLAAEMIAHAATYRPRRSA